VPAAGKEIGFGDLFHDFSFNLACSDYIAKQTGMGLFCRVLGFGGVGTQLKFIQGRAPGAVFYCHFTKDFNISFFADKEKSAGAGGSVPACRIVFLGTETPPIA